MYYLEVKTKDLSGWLISLEHGSFTTRQAVRKEAMRLVHEGFWHTNVFYSPTIIQWAKVIENDQ